MIQFLLLSSKIRRGINNGSGSVSQLLFMTHHFLFAKH